MSAKIFISYRRDDSGANALGISQYLEREFGRKNVFIDVDMRAGAKFPTVLEERLSECKVMLVLIGPGWLNAQDEQGTRRIDNAGDWVRLEIAHALRRNITVIPIRVNGAPLPTRATLPDEMQGLLDHQAVSVSLAGFRHEMASLVRDIRSIRSRTPWRRVAYVAAAASSVAALLAIIFQFVGIQGLHIRPVPSQHVTGITNGTELWNSRPGEWVFYAIDKNPFAYYIKPSSVKTFGNRVAFDGRYPVAHTATRTSDKMASENAYEEVVTVLDCKSSQFAMSERTVFDKNGHPTFHFKWADPESLDLSVGGKVSEGTVISMAQRILCDEQMRAELVAGRRPPNDFSYLSSTATGDGDIFYGKPKAILNSPYQSELPTLVKFHQNHSFSDLFPGQDVIGLPKSAYSAHMEPVELDCTDRKIRISQIEYFDPNGYMLNFTAFMPAQQIDVKVNPFVDLLAAGCANSVLQVGGTYEGSNHASYGTGGAGEEKISFFVIQTGETIDVTFQTAAGGKGKGTGRLAGSEVNSMPIQSTIPSCPGSYVASLKFNGDTVNWSYKGKDCGGSMQGYGSAKRANESTTLGTKEQVGHALPD